MLNWIIWNGTVFDSETVLMLNWIVWDRIVFDKNYTYTKLNFFFLIRTVWLNWIVWSRNILDN